jgi:hypothetical protein
MDASTIDFCGRVHLQAEKVNITSLEKCDFKPMYEYFETQKEKKKAMSAAEKKRSVWEFYLPR